MTSFSIYNWRILVFKSDLPANAKYIGCYLSTYMNEHGDNCYPSIARICHETCLSKPTVIKYIQVLRDGEWLETKKKGFDGQAWAHNQYYPNIPKKVVKEINQLTEGGKAPLQRRLTSGQKAVKEVNTSSTVNSVVSSTEEKPVVQYPEKLNIEAWTDYIEYRKQSKFKKLQRKSEELQIEKLIGYGDKTVQRDCINETISNGWQGIFAPKRNGNNGKSKADSHLAAIRNL